MYPERVHGQVDAESAPFPSKRAASGDGRQGAFCAARSGVLRAVGSLAGVASAVGTIPGVGHQGGSSELRVRLLGPPYPWAHLRQDHLLSVPWVESVSALDDFQRTQAGHLEVCVASIIGFVALDEPVFLVDDLSQQIMAADSEGVILGPDRGSRR